MYWVEVGQHGFSSIPQSIYWEIITVTTVGYGDIVPFTVLGKFIASFAMIIGYAIIAVPTGIVTSEMIKPMQRRWYVLLVMLRCSQEQNIVVIVVWRMGRVGNAHSISEGDEGEVYTQRNPRSMS